MSDLNPTSSVREDQLSRALSRVHGRLRRRRNRLRGGGAAALACLALLGTGVATQNGGSEADAPMAMTGPEQGIQQGDAGLISGAICGRAPAAAEAFGLELAIDGPVAWPTSSIHFGAAPWITVVAHNLGTRSLTITVPAGVVGLTDEALVDSEVSAPVMMPTTLTLEPSESVELPARLPNRSCTGDALDGGSFTLIPIVAVELGDSRLVVGGSPLTVRRR